ncbi:hypothetical protein OS31_20060 [Dickeya oryzae]
MTTSLELLEEHRLFGGWQRRYRHASTTLHCDMTFSVFYPPVAGDTPPPVLYWLSGLTCNDENFTTKSGAQRFAAELGLVLIMPDTSPRGDNVPDDAQYDLGKGAGFYVNATQAPWDRHFRMFDYISDELPALVRQHISASDRLSISGHSMGGTRCTDDGTAPSRPVSFRIGLCPNRQPDAGALGAKSLQRLSGG